MIVKILQENLLRALLRAGRVVPSKPQLPVVQNVLLETEGGQLLITATSLETTTIIRVGAKIEKEGGICVPSRLLSEFVSSLPAATTEMSTKEGALIVTSGGYRATIPGIPKEEFPPVVRGAKGEKTTIDKDQLMLAAGSVLFSAATDEGRPILSGIKIHTKDGETTFVATDGYRLSVRKIRLKTSGGIAALVPAKALSEVLKTGGEERGASSVVVVTPPGGQAIFTIGDTEIHTRLIDGEYPNYEKIIPAKHNTRALLEKEAFTRAVKSAAIFARDSANIVRLHIENQVITVSANAPQVGEDETRFEAKVDGEGGDIAFNSRFLLEFLANIEGEEVVFEMTGSLNPGVFKPVKDDSYLHIIMPVRLSG